VNLAVCDNFTSYQILPLIEAYPVKKSNFSGITHKSTQTKAKMVFLVAATIALSKKKA
jgi:hypothetical protein